MDTKKLRQKILDLAIRGKLVPQDPNDEPASVLLERIRAEKEQLIKEGKIKRSKKSAASDTSHYENVPFEVPESWCWVNIMEVLVKLTDGTHHSPKNYPKGNYKYITAKNIKNEGVVLDGVTYVDDETHHEIFSRCNPEYGDILYIKDGATTGVVAINNLEEEFSLLSSVALLKPSKLISKKYLFYYLQSSYCYESVRSSMKGVGITRITLKQIADWEVPIPPIEEQHRIVEYIDSLFAQIDLIAKDTATLNLFLEKYKHGILNLAIAGKLVPQDPSDEHAVKLLTRINPGYKPCDNRHYENIELSIPETWCWATIGDVFKHNTGKALNSSNHSGIMMDYITTSNLYWDRFDLSTVKQMPFTEKDLGKCTVTKGDLLICEGGDVGRSAIWNYNYDIRIQNHIHRLRGKANICVRYFLYVFMLYKQRNYIGGKGVAIQGLSSRDLNRLVIPLPPLNEQYRIAKSVDNIFSTIDNILLEL